MKSNILEIIEDEEYLLLTLNRPDQRNALNKALRAQLHAAIYQYAESKKVIILAGNGKAFCAGLDLKDNPNKEALIEFWSLIKKIQSSKCIFIAAVNSIAIGGGLIIANACDIAIGSDQSRYGMPNVNTDVHTALQDPLSKLKGSEYGQAWKDITGKLISAQEALDQGIINAISTTEDSIPHSLEIAHQICTYNKEHLIESKQKEYKILHPEERDTEVMILGNRENKDFRKWLS